MLGGGAGRALVSRRRVGGAGASRPAVGRPARRQSTGRLVLGGDQVEGRRAVRELLAAAGIAHPPGDFKRIASARALYHWNADANQTY